MISFYSLKAEKLSGVDLDGDGLIAGKPAPAKAQAQAPAQAPTTKAAGGNVDLGSAAGKVTTFLRESGKLNTGGGGFLAMFNSFKTFSPQVQAQAENTSRDLDDGANMQVSSLTGKRKSLLVGINYPGTSAQLRGCHNDVKNVQKLITEKFKFGTDPNSMRVLLDDGASQAPTRANIIAGMK